MSAKGGWWSKQNDTAKSIAVTLLVMAVFGMLALALGPLGVTPEVWRQGGEALIYLALAVFFAFRVARSFIPKRYLEKKPTAPNDGEVRR